jgi:hypothetical protein
MDLLIEPEPEPEPELAAMVRAAGVYLPNLSAGRGRAVACEDICDVKACASAGLLI